MLTPTELTLDTPGGRIAALAWGPEDGRPVLALHGWLDSAATWSRLAPLFCEARSARVVAVDFPGHGRSDHRGPDAWYGFPDLLMTVSQVVDALGWERLTLLGHSMGGAVATLWTGTFPERVDALLLSEGLTPLTNAPDEARDVMRKGLMSQAKYRARTPRTVASLDEVEARIAARPWRLTPAAVRALAARAAAPVDGGWRFTHDPRLRADSLVRYTQGQVMSFLSAIECPAVLVAAQEGISYRQDEITGYIERAAERLRVVRVAGRHHVHLDDPALVLPPLLEVFDATERA